MCGHSCERKSIQENFWREEKFEHEGPASKIAIVDSAFLIRLYLDVPLDKKSTLQVENELPRTVGNLQVKTLQRISLIWLLVLLLLVTN